MGDRTGLLLSAYLQPVLWVDHDLTPAVCGLRVVVKAAFVYTDDDGQIVNQLQTTVR